jgi:hypothetical protein
MHRRWTFTVNNWTQDDEDRIVAFTSSTLPSGKDRVIYLCYASEVGDSGTPHLQGYVVLSSPARRTYLTAYMCSRAWLSPARGTSIQNKEYCSKDGEDRFVEFGSCPSEDNGAEKQAADWDYLKTLAWENKLDEIPANMYIRHYNVWNDLARRGKEERARQGMTEHFESKELRPWQSQLYQELSVEPDDRTITWVYDPSGAGGKSWFANYLMVKSNFDDSVCVLRPGRSTDIARCLPASPRIVIFDIPRSRAETVDWGIIECIKDGRVFSGKYESSVKLFKPPHLVVFSNADVPDGAFSSDRIRRIQL